MSTMAMLVAAIVIVSPILIAAECQCTASGDPHYTMCDKRTRFDFQAEGLFTAFKSADLEVQVFQTMAKNKPVAYVDYCSIKFTKDDCNFVMKTRSIREPNKIVINGEKMNVTNGAAFVEKEIDKKLGVTFDANHDVVFRTSDGVVHVICKPQQMIIRAPDTKKCEGLCGDCSGKPQTKPAKPVQHACAEVHQPSGNCKPKPVPAPTPQPTTVAATAKPTPQPTTAAATAKPTPQPTNATAAPTVAPTPAPVTPAPTTSAATPQPAANLTTAPGTPAPSANATSQPANTTITANMTTAPTNASIAPPPVKEADKSKIVGHPVFESEDVMKKVINACMCGQPKERMVDDQLFGGFVENCIYDKSLGPNEEDIAAANMEAFLKVVTPIPDVVFADDNVTVTPAPTRPAVTVIGNVTYSNDDFNTSAIREKHVTRMPTEIPPTAGVSYKLRFVIPDDDVALIPELMPRPLAFTGAGERTDPIMPTPAQQMAMAQQGMPMPPSPLSPPGLPTSYLAPNTPGAAMPPRSPMGPASAMGPRPNERPFPFSDKFNEKFPAGGNDDDKLKVHFDLEAPIIVTAK